MKRASVEVGDNGLGKIIASGSEAAGRNDGAGSSKRIRDGGADGFDVVAYRGSARHAQAGRGKLLAEEGCVGIESLAEQQLIANGHDLDHQRASPPIALRTASSSDAGVKGFSRNPTSGVTMPCGKTASSV